MSDFIAGKALRKLLKGNKVVRATAAIPQNAAQDIFTVVGGRVFIHALFGVVTTAINDEANNTKLISNPTVGAAIDICTVTSIQNRAIGSLLGAPGAVGSALVVGNALSGQTGDYVVSAGVLQLHCANATGTGSIAWTVFYTPIDDGAYIEAA